MTGAAGLLVSPVSWAHHWVWIVPALAVLIRDSNRKAALTGYILFALSPLWWTPHNGHPLEYGLHILLAPVANCYLLAGVVFLVRMAARLRNTSYVLTSGRGGRRRPAGGAGASRAVRDPEPVGDG